MKSAILILTLVGVASAAVQYLSPEHIRILDQIRPSSRESAASSDLRSYLESARRAVILSDQREELEHPDLYLFDFDTSNGIRHRQAGALNNEGSKDEALNVAGQYSYLGPDGVIYTVFYTADENGFQPAGEHIPPAANTSKKPKLGVGNSALASLSGGGLGK